ncbi:MAG TPA: glycosyltransferase [Deltaproteobacteria bacterium]|nr:glycosyltransferase [Deltaproteobacteria bacterium]
MIHFLSPGAGGVRTGGYLYNARLIEGLHKLGRGVSTCALQGGWPIPEPVDRRRCAEQIAALPPGPIVADGLLWTGVAQSLGPSVARRCLVLVHSPLWREEGDALRAPEEAALAAAARVVCTSARTASDLAIAAPCAVIEPGTDRAPPAAAVGGARLLCVATVTPRKAHDVLVDALARLSVPWRLRCAGSLDRDVAWADEVVAQARRLGVADRIDWLGELAEAELAAEYASASILVHPARYEGWGMALAEALARGLPVVSTPAGIFEARSEARGSAWIEVAAADPGALASALGQVLSDPRRAASLHRHALALALPDWPRQVARFVEQIDAMEVS